MLISDISHQVKTPVSNLQMVTDTLLTKPVSEEERMDFLQGIRSQTDKLDFLFQALVKTSRLETGAIRLEKKDSSLFHTLAQAMSSIVYAAEKKEIAVSVDCPENLIISHDSKWTSEALFNSILQTIDLKKYYGTEPNITRALDGVNFTVEQGEFVAVVGTSGSGKSTLLHMMGGLDTPTSGSVIVRGEELAKKNDDELTIFRRRNIGFIFQNYNLVPILNVYENIALPVELDGDTVDKKFMDEVVYMLALEDKLENMPNNLSGGQQQRVAIARALITKPAIVLADEPTGNLDSKTSADVLGLLKRTSGEFNQTIVMITHNNEIAQLADRIVRIEDGKIVG